MPNEKSNAERRLDAAKADQVRAQAAVDAERREKAAKASKADAPQRVLVSKHDSGSAVVVARAR